MQGQEVEEDIDLDFEDVNAADDFTLSPASPYPPAKSPLSSPTRANFQYNPVISEVASRGFQGYSLPDSAEYSAREVKIVGDAYEGETEPRIRSGRATFGGRPLEESGGVGVGGRDPHGYAAMLEDLGYLGEAISGN